MDIVCPAHEPRRVENQRDAGPKVMAEEVFNSRFRNCSPRTHFLNADLTSLAHSVSDRIYSGKADLSTMTRGRAPRQSAAAAGCRAAAKYEGNQVHCIGYVDDKIAIGVPREEWRRSSTAAKDVGYDEDNIGDIDVLRGVGVATEILADIAYAVVVTVGLIVVGDGRAVVAGIPNAVVVGVSLSRIGYKGTIVQAVGDTVLVKVAALALVRNQVAVLVGRGAGRDIALVENAVSIAIKSGKGPESEAGGMRHAAVVAADEATIESPG